MPAPASSKAEPEVDSFSQSAQEMQEANARMLAELEALKASDAGQEPPQDERLAELEQRNAELRSELELQKKKLVVGSLLRQGKLTPDLEKWALEQTVESLEAYGSAKAPAAPQNKVASDATVRETKAQGLGEMPPPETGAKKPWRSGLASEGGFFGMVPSKWITDNRPHRAKARY